jgi:large subunit ribosomal protein L35
MGKLKTHKATAKRFAITKTKKVLKRKAGQDHYNSRETGKIVRNKRRDVAMTNKKENKTIKSLIPYA